MNYNGLPLYEAKIDINDNETGMYCISLVDLPATESDFLAFDKTKELLKYSIENEEQHKVFGLVMAADMPIYRIGNSGYEYYITYSRKTIELMAEKYFKNGLQNNVDTMHNFQMEDGVTLCEMYIKDSEKGITPKGYEEYADGSLFATFHIENEEVWAAVKSGEYKGFSLAGTFTVEPIKDNKEEVKHNKIMSKMAKVKEFLSKVLETLEFNEVSTDKGLVRWSSDNELPEVGETVNGVDEEGNEIALEDGNYTLEDKTVLVIKGNKVEEVIKPEPEEPAATEDEPTAEPEPEEPVAAEEEEPVVEPEPEPTAEPEPNPLEEKVNALEALVAKLEERIAALEAAPAAAPAQEDFKKVNKTIDNLNKRLNAKW